MNNDFIYSFFSLSLSVCHCYVYDMIKVTQASLALAIYLTNFEYTIMESHKAQIIGRPTYTQTSQQFWYNNLFLDMWNTLSSLQCKHIR